MLRATVLLSILLMSTAACAAGDVTRPLEGGLVLKLHEVMTARNVPHVYVDQALESLSAPGAKADILACRRIGSLGGNAAASYSLIAYATSAQPSEVAIEGQVLVQGRAWSYALKAPRKEWEHSLLLVIEALSGLPPSANLTGQ
jgi:hypothetical protein